MAESILLPGNFFVSIQKAIFNVSTKRTQKPLFTFSNNSLKSFTFTILFCGIRLLYKNSSRLNFFIRFTYISLLTAVDDVAGCIVIEFLKSSGESIALFIESLSTIPSI